ncbi:MAG: hypothetical protein HYS25_00840 [Ignavibacteriales bacterium]|nr:hypothetical protein [Ignavibacteriales bacterium]
MSLLNDKWINLTLAKIKSLLSPIGTAIGIGTDNPLAVIDARGEGDILNCSNGIDQDLKVNISAPGAATKKALLTTSTNTMIAFGLQGADALRIKPGNNVEIVNQLTVLGGLAGLPLEKIKIVDETVTNSATLQNDDHLLLTNLPFSTSYCFDLFLYGQSVQNGLQVNWDLPGGDAQFKGVSTISGVALENDSNYGYYRDLTTAIGSSSIPNWNWWNSSIMQTGRTFRIRGVLTTGTYGTMNLQIKWAQYAANTTGTILFKGSYLRLYKI